MDKINLSYSCAIALINFFWYQLTLLSVPLDLRENPENSCGAGKLIFCILVISEIVGRAWLRFKGVRSRRLPEAYPCISYWLDHPISSVINQSDESISGFLIFFLILWIFLNY